ncbi:hypothetical protein [Streptomyces sp. B1I3]|uniref:hypothetical protein n=1 Tax=Streptomyces sp. B1I3 TaxID=3042264 RepID=UPI0027872EEF|nr:hypothetical protein [Streptomyces sp. B1I3]MDQ0791673.1 hypothetical protein [Streptomyces sp. B1I3]
MPIAFAPASRKAGARETLRDIFATTEPTLTTARACGRTLISDKICFGRALESQPANSNFGLPRQAARARPSGPGSRLFEPLWQVIESINEPFTDRLDPASWLNPQGVIVRVLQRVLALAAASWPNEYTGQPVMPSLAPYDH